MSSQQVETIEDLLAMGGKFYQIGNDCWCDTALDSWKLIPGFGYVRAEDLPIAISKDRSKL